jgi:hypothetical protein
MKWWVGGAVMVIVALAAAIWRVHLAEQNLAEEHKARVDAEAKVTAMTQSIAQLQTVFQSESELARQCEESTSKNLSDSMARLQTRTALVTLAPEQAQGGLLPLAAQISHMSTLGLLLELVQAAQQHSSGRATRPAQVWILPTSVEPTFGGDISHAWVIHSDVQTGQAVDQPHHPFPITGQ